MQGSMDIDGLIGASDAMNANISEVLHTQGSRNAESLGGSQDETKDGTGQEIFVLRRLFAER